MWCSYVWPHWCGALMYVCTTPVWCSYIWPHWCDALMYGCTTPAVWCSYARITATNSHMMKVSSGSQRRSTLARLLLAQDVNRRRQRTSIAAWSLLHKMEWMPSFLTVSTISYIRLVTGWDGVNNDNNNNKNLHEVSSKGLGEVQASCCCRWPCCLGGSPGLRTTGRDLGKARGQ